MADETDRDDWTQRWPAAVDRVEVWDGRLMYELRGFGKSAWTDEDVVAAQRCYPGQRVTLSASRTRLFVDAPVARSSAASAELDAARGGPGGDSDTADTGPGAASRQRTVIRVSADQHDAARALVRLRGGLDKVPPLIAKVAQARPAPAAAHEHRT